MQPTATMKGGPVHRLCLVLSLFVISSIGPSSSAFAEHDASTPLLHSYGGDGPIWASYRLSTDGAMVEGWAEAYKLALPTQVGAVVYDAEDRVLTFATFTGVPSANGVYADVNRAPGQNIRIDLRQPRPELNLLRLRLRINDPALDRDPVTGEIKLLLWAIGETKRTTPSGPRDCPCSFWNLVEGDSENPSVQLHRGSRTLHVEPMHRRNKADQSDQARDGHVES